MGYLHIPNTYRAEGQHIFLFKECYALEKIHGTSAHISFNPTYNDLHFSSGGESHARFVGLFDSTQLLAAFTQLGSTDVITVYGEAYGGKQQGMSDTYGKELKFVVFDIMIGDKWMDVPVAEEIAKKLNLELHQDLNRLSDC